MQPSRHPSPFLVTATLIAAAVSAGAAALPGFDTAAAVRQLEAEYGAATRVERHPATGAARLVVLPSGSTKATADRRSAALGFLDRHGELFGIADPSDGLALVSDRRDRLGGSRLTFEQRIGGVPVFAGVLRAHFDADGRLTAVNGFTVPGGLDTEPKVAAPIAMQTALEAARKLTGRGGLTIGEVRLVVYHTGAGRWTPGDARLAWEIEILDGGVARELALVDARRGAILDRFDLVHDLRRMVGLNTSSNIVWREGDPLPYSGTGPVADAEINTIIEATRNTYDLFAHLSGGAYLSHTGSDTPMISVYDADFIDCPNAVATGNLTGYCPGVASDDVVAHEWTHNYTGTTHGLIYAWQPGALNEAYSDIFGEVVDLLNGIGVDSPASLRSPGACSTFGGSAPVDAAVLEPADLAGPLAVGDAEFNPRPPWTVEAAVEAVDDGVGVGADGCETPVGFTAGRIALVDRGSCMFQQKALAAQDAGAAAVIIVNLESDQAIGMASGGGAAPAIPAISVGRTTGQRIRDALAEGVTLRISSGGPSESSVRWLIGEDDGVIRDMWNPSCAGDPARVADPRYWCSEEDNGGVHTNSGVANHAFALLVDGGEFNGRTVAPIGLTKASHVYWRAMSVYQVPTTGFAEHADLLELSCRDLIGAELTDLTTGGHSSERLAASDCRQVEEAMAAVEMRLAPEQCGFQPILAPGAPRVDGSTVLLRETFDTDPGTSWPRSNQGVYPEYDPRDWVWTTDVPDGGDGGAMYALNDVELGDCRPFSDDQSGVMRLETPAFELPGRRGRVVVTLDHYVATEPGWDGGNVWISVNGGSYRQLAATAFRFNPYNGRIVSSTDGNSNPLAGQEGFTGADDGSFSGSWGQSQVDLAGHAGPGDTVRLRFDLGVDGCNGNDGWYLDAVAVVLLPEAPRAGGGRVGG